MPNRLPAIVDDPISRARDGLGGLIALATSIGIGRFVYTPILPSMMHAIPLSSSAAGWIASANFAGYLAGALVVSRLQLRTRSWILGGLLASALTTTAMGTVRSVVLFVIFRAAGGFASAIVLVLACATVLTDPIASGGIGPSAMMYSGVGIGVVVSALLVSGLQALNLGWAALWIASGTLSGFGVLLCAHLLSDHHPKIAMPRLATMMPRDPRFTRTAVAYGLFGFGYVITATFLLAMVRSRPNTGSLESLVWVVFGVAAVASLALWSAIEHRLGTGRAFALASVTEALGVACTAAWHNNAGVLAGAVLVGGTFMGLTAIGLNRGRQFASENLQTGLAVLTSAFGVGQIVGPGFAGLLSEWTGSISAAFFVAAAALLASAGLVLV